MNTEINDVIKQAMMQQTMEKCAATLAGMIKRGAFYDMSDGSILTYVNEFMESEGYRKERRMEIESDVWIVGKMRQRSLEYVMGELR